MLKTIQLLLSLPIKYNEDVRRAKGYYKLPENIKDLKKLIKVRWNG